MNMHAKVVAAAVIGWSLDSRGGRLGQVIQASLNNCICDRLCQDRGLRFTKHFTLVTVTGVHEVHRENAERRFFLPQFASQGRGLEAVRFLTMFP